MANYTRFSPSDWASSNIDHYNSADASRSLTHSHRPGTVSNVVTVLLVLLVMA